MRRSTSIDSRKATTQQRLCKNIYICVWQFKSWCFYRRRQPTANAPSSSIATYHSFIHSINHSFIHSYHLSYQMPIWARWLRRLIRDRSTTAATRTLATFAYMSLIYSIYFGDVDEQSWRSEVFFFLFLKPRWITIDNSNNRTTRGGEITNIYNL